MRLASGAPQIKHQIARDLQSESRAVIFLDQCQRQIHSGCDSGRRVNIFITNKYWIAFDARARGTLDQSLAPVPMGRCAAAVEQARAGEQHCACANRTDSPNSCGDSFQPAHRFRVNFVLLDCVAAGHEQRVDLATHFAKSPIGGDAHTAVSNQRSTGRNAYDFDRIDRRRTRICPRRWTRYATGTT